MNPATLAIASDFVKAGIDKAGVPLTASLEAYLSITFARFMGRSIGVDLLTVRVTAALDAGAPRDAIRALAEGAGLEIGVTAVTWQSPGIQNARSHPEGWLPVKIFPRCCADRKSVRMASNGCQRLLQNPF